MTTNGTNRLETFLRTPAGERFLAEAEAAAAAKEAAVQARRDLATQREALLRRRRDVLPGLRERVAAREVVVAEAQAALRAARDALSDARSAAFHEDSSVRNGLGGAEFALRRSADPRLLAAIEEADDVHRAWPSLAGGLRRTRSERETSWNGTESWVRRAGSNQAGIDALHRDIEVAKAAIEPLALVAEPTDEQIAEALSRVAAAIAATKGDPRPIVLVEYDREGRPRSR